MSTERLEILISIIGGFCAIFKWVYEYSKKIRWEKNKFLLDRLDNFHKLESTQVMEIMLDWNGTDVEYQGEKMFIDDDILFESFLTHDIKHRFTKKEFMLRSIFDDYFDNLTRLIFMAEMDLIEKKSLVIFLQYWFKILAGKYGNKSTALTIKIHRYLEFYGYDALIKFIKDEI
jgi:hypothetical protein